MQEINQYNNKGNREGYWERYYSNGNPCYKGHFKDGKQEGYWEEYNYYDGSLRYSAFYATD